MTPDGFTSVQLRTHVFTTPLRAFGTEGKHWSPCASTLVTGETDAVDRHGAHQVRDQRAWRHDRANRQAV
jgi:hypothetical protein